MFKCVIEIAIGETLFWTESMVDELELQGHSHTLRCSDLRNVNDRLST